MLTKKPGQQLVFLPTANARLLAENLSALANADGGMIVLGVAQDGSLAPEVWVDDAEDALQLAVQLIKPPVPAEWRTLQTKQGKQLISLFVPRSDDLHTLSDGRILKRHGIENRPMFGQDLTMLSNTRTVGDFENEIVPGARRTDFDDDIIQEYVSNLSRRGGAMTDGLERLLFEIGALDHHGNPTVTGVLLFTKKPQIFLPQSGITFVRFPDVKPRGEGGGAGYGRRDEITGPLARVVERAWRIVWEEMRVGAKVTGLERKDILEYPRFAVREAIINAVCHRDYRIQGRRIEIRMYTDRLEVISPGGLAGWMTLENLVDEHYSRNPRIVNGLYQWGYIEELGLGIDLMIEEMVEAGHPKPQFLAPRGLFTVKLFNKQQQAQTALQPHRKRPSTIAIESARPSVLNERQLRAMQYVKQYGSISNREYKRICEGNSAETLRRDLADLVKRDLLMRVGLKKGTHYILK